MTRHILIAANSVFTQATSSESTIKVNSWRDFQLHQNRFVNDTLKGVVIDWNIHWKDLPNGVHPLWLVIRALRMVQRLNVPILIIEDQSSLPKAPDQHWKNRIQRDPDNQFLSADDLSQLSIEGLSEMLAPQPENPLLRKEVQTLVYNDLGYMELLVHEAGAQLRKQDSSKGKKTLGEFFDAVDTIYPLIREEARAIRSNTIGKVAPDHDLNDLQLLLTEGRNLLYTLLATQRAPEPIRELPRQQVQILLIDDDKDFHDRFRERVRPYNIEPHFASNGNEAMSILREDRDNRITLVICDYLFYEEGRFSREQGPHIIQRISQLPNYFSIIYLTGIQSSALKNLAKTVLFIQKRDIFSHNRLIQVIYEQHQQIKEQILSPSCFNEQMRILYKQHRESDDFEHVEYEFNQEAYRITIAFKKTGKPPTHVSKGFQARIDHKDRPRLNLKNFRKKLLGRRIALGVCQLSLSAFPRALDLKDKWIYIMHILKPGDGFPYDDNIRDLLNTHLRLFTKLDYHFSESANLPITLEEKNFIKQYGTEFES